MPREIGSNRTGNGAKRLKTLRDLTPHEYVCKVWTENPERFRLNPLHHTAGPNT